MFVIHVQYIFKSKKRSVLIEGNSLQLDELNKRVARKRVEYLKKRRAALYLRERRVDAQTWM